MEWMQESERMRMAKHYCTDDRCAQIVIALMKVHSARNLVVTPGATNVCFVLRVHGDPNFMLYSAADERHVDYFVCGFVKKISSSIFSYIGDCGKGEESQGSLLSLDGRIAMGIWEKGAFCRVSNHGKDEQRERKVVML